MSLDSRIRENRQFEDVDPGYVSEAALDQLMTVILAESLTPDELEEVVAETTLYPVTEKNIVKLDKNAQLQRAYKTAILQCASEDGRKEYKKMRTLWKMEAFLMKKLEKVYKAKAMARARLAMKELKKKKSKGAQIAGARFENKAVKGASNLLKSGPVKLGQR